MIMSPKTRIREMLLSLITCVETFSTVIHGIMKVYCISVAVRVKVSMRVDCVWSSGLWCLEDVHRPLRGRYHVCFQGNHLQDYTTS
jgi:hypothetical protein